MPDENKQVTLSDVVKPIEEKSKTTQKQPEESSKEIPAKYADKSLEDIITMHQNAEKALSRQGAELGEVRRLADQLIQADIGNRVNTKQESSEAESFDLDSFDDPKKAAAALDSLVERKVEQRLQGVNQEVSELRGLTVEQRLNADHPNWRSVVTSQEYTDWVRSSPVRMRLAQEGDSGNYASGHELLSMWEALNPSSSAESNVVEQDTAEALKNATLETGSSKRYVAKKPMFRKIDLERLRTGDPDKYDMMRAEIREAFIEGRVK